jgi:fatty acid desaturase
MTESKSVFIRQKSDELFVRRRIYLFVLFLYLFLLFFLFSFDLFCFLFYFLLFVSFFFCFVLLCFFFNLWGLTPCAPPYESALRYLQPSSVKLSMQLLLVGDSNGHFVRILPSFGIVVTI